jgi:predicted PurR-regulated permease PerM
MNEPVTKHSTPSKRGTSIGARVGVLVLAAAAIAGVVVCVLLAAPFLGALTWALALAILFAPLHERIEARLKARLKYPDFAAAVSILIIALVVAVPAAFVVERLVVEAAASATIIQARVASGAVQRLLEAHPGIAPIGNWIEEQIDLPAVIANLATSLSNVGASFARRSIIQSIEVVLTFYFLYYFLRDRHSAGRVLRNGCRSRVRRRNGSFSAPSILFMPRSTGRWRWQRCRVPWGASCSGFLACRHLSFGDW